MTTFVSAMDENEARLYAEINKLHKKYHKYNNWYDLKIKKTMSFADYKKYGRFYIWNYTTNKVYFTDIDPEDYLVDLENQVLNFGSI